MQNLAGNDELAHEILVLFTLSNNEGSDEPAQMHRLARWMHVGVFSDQKLNF